MGRVANRLDRTKRRADYVVGTNGDVVTLADLPVPGSTRWVPRKKAQVVAAVRGGLITLEDACERYALTVEEYLSWQTAIKEFGLPGLRATHVQDYRHIPRQ